MKCIFSLTLMLLSLTFIGCSTVSTAWKLRHSLDEVYTCSELEAKLPEFIKTLNEKNYAETTAWLNHLKRGKYKTVDGRDALEVFLILLLNRDSQETLVREWINDQPKSSMAHALLGYFLVQKAWGLRGSQYARETSKENMASFVSVLKEAKTILETAHELDPKNYIASSKLITVTMGLNGQDEELNLWFKRSITAPPSVLWGL